MKINNKNGNVQNLSRRNFIKKSGYSTVAISFGAGLLGTTLVSCGSGSSDSSTTTTENNSPTVLNFSYIANSNNPTSSIDISWAVSNATGYTNNLYKNIENEFETATSLATSVTSPYTDSSLLDTQTYYYWVELTDETTTVQSSSLSASPEDLVFSPTLTTKASSNSIIVNWTSQSGIIYELWGIQDDSDTVAFSTISRDTTNRLFNASGSSYTHFSLENGKQYHYWIIGNDTVSSYSLTSIDNSQANAITVVDTGTLPIPPLLESSSTGTYTLDTMTVASQTHDFGGLSRTSDTIGISIPSQTMTYHGPTIRVTNGDVVTFNIQNNYTESVTNHWHGLHINGNVDGAEHHEITTNSTWSPTLNIAQDAGTSWYHSHIHGSTQEQVNKGYAGLFIIEDANSKALNLPQSYGVDDFPIIIKSQGFTGDVISPTGNGNGDKMLFNGAASTTNPTLKVEKKWIRFRLLNGSDQDDITVSFSDNRTFYVIATDGGFLDNAVSKTSLGSVAPAERYEIITDFTSDNTGETIQFNAAATVGGAGGGSTNYSFTIEIKDNDSGENGVTTLDTSMDLRGSNGVDKINWQTNYIDVYGAGGSSDLESNPVVTIKLGGDRGARWTNVVANSTAQGYYSAGLETNKVFDMNYVNFAVKKNIWQVWEFGTTDHPLHVHGCSFMILSEGNNSNNVSDEHKGWKDVIKAPANSKFLVKFNFHTYSTDFATNSRSDASASSGEIGTNHKITDYKPYMYHCHILPHEDEGMMGQFNVIES